MTQSLNDKLTVASEMGFLSKVIPADLRDNLSPKITLRPYQEQAMERFLFFVEDFKGRPKNPHLLFHMATGSGKTVIMAALILDLYRRGYRNFMFFVNSTQIIEKTKENFLNPGSSKYLFAPQIRIDDKLVEVRAVDTFDAASQDVINIHFTTIQGLHSRINDPRENAVTIEDFSDYKVVMISDEAHHLNAETKKALTGEEEDEKVSWEKTVRGIFAQHAENMLLEFTATVDLTNEAIKAKYHDKIIYDYSLGRFREDGYSKDIELRQADLPPAERMLQAIVLSQYRRKVAEAHSLHCKPVVLMKSKTIAESTENEEAFTALVKALSGEQLLKLRTATAASKDDITLNRAFAYIFDERAVLPDDFAMELRGDFAPEKAVNVNNPKDLEKRQIELNALEDRDNEIRVIFAVDKLNEGWDVLNLFDIVRLYDKRDGKDNKVGKTTMAEAQLIGRGARYFPFVSADKPDAAREKRKFDSALDSPLRVLEELHYHCSHNPKYIQDIRNALRETGMIDDNTRTASLRLKDAFKATDFYKSEKVWLNARVKNTREGVAGLGSYKVEKYFVFPALLTGRVTEASAFVDPRVKAVATKTAEPEGRTLDLVSFGTSILRFACDANDFFHFANLHQYFPALPSLATFLSDPAYLGGARVEVRGLPEELDNLTAQQKLHVAQFVLTQIEAGIRRESIDFVGTKDFKPHALKDLFIDKTLKLRLEGETGLGWKDSKIPGLDQIDLASKPWHVFEDSFGTDQEKLFVRHLNDHAQRLNELYEEFYLIRNEKALTLYSFKDGQAFEPDFLLFLRKTKEAKATIYQLFIEPKGTKFWPDDQWKEDFLKTIEPEARLETVFQDKEYKVYGLPFFNDEAALKASFEGAFIKSVGA